MTPPSLSPLRSPRRRRRRGTGASQLQRGVTLAEVGISVVVLAILVITGFSSASIGTNRSVEVSREKVARDIAHSRAEALAETGALNPWPDPEVVERNNTPYRIAYLVTESGEANRTFVVVTIRVTWGKGDKYIYELDTVVAKD